MLTKQKPNPTTHYNTLKRLFTFRVVLHVKKKKIKERRLSLHLIIIDWKLYFIRHKLIDNLKDRKENECWTADINLVLCLGAKSDKMLVSFKMALSKQTCGKATVSINVYFSAGATVMNRPYFFDIVRTWHKKWHIERILQVAATAKLCHCAQLTHYICYSAQREQKTTLCPRFYLLDACYKWHWTQGTQKKTSNRC